MKHLIVCLFLASTSSASTIASISCSARSNETIDSHKIDTAGSVECYSAFGDGHSESSASASVEYGKIRTYAQALVIPSNGDSLDHAGASVLAQYTDTLTIMGSGSGTMRVLLIFPGPTQTGSTAAFEMGDGHASQGSPFVFPNIPSPIVTLLIPVNFGQPISIKAWAGQSAHADVSDNAQSEQVFTQILTLLGSNGLSIQGFEYMSEGVSVIGGNRIAAAGPPVHTPEPASVITLAAACIGMLLLRRALQRAKRARWLL